MNKAQKDAEYKVMSKDQFEEAQAREKIRILTKDKNDPNKANKNLNLVMSHK
jgi:hypothetical protein